MDPDRCRWQPYVDVNLCWRKLQLWRDNHRWGLLLGLQLLASAGGWYAHKPFSSDPCEWQPYVGINFDWKISLLRRDYVRRWLLLGIWELRSVR